MLHIRQIRFISLSSANCRCSTTTCQDSLSESSHVRQNHSTWCFGLLTAIYFDVLSQYGILRGSAPRCQRVLLYFPAARCYRFVDGKNTDNLLKKKKEGDFVSVLKMPELKGALRAWPGDGEPSPTGVLRDGHCWGPEGRFC